MEEIFVIIGIIVFSIILPKIFGLTKKTIKKQEYNFINKETNRVLYENAREYENWNSQGRLFIRGMAMIVNDDGIPELIPQAKLTDIGLLH